MKMRTLDDLYLHELHDLYYASNRLGTVLPKLAKRATAKTAIHHLKTHAIEAKVQAERLEQIFRSLHKAIKGERCQALTSLLDDTTILLNHSTDPQITDHILMVMGRKITHQTIGQYRNVIELAKILGHSHHITLLKQGLADEKTADTHFLQAIRKIASQHETGAAVS